ncbi:MAG: protein kinase [Synechococcaceae cyanobacterium SM1_2_3]|nr:protein kinase [Synechococcaceae cyanobacterium SM1_2_3]
MHIPGYQIERELGQGGMAIVYLALQESLHRHVALKIIKPVLTTDEEFAQRFLREGRIIAQLSDPHIVTVYDIASYEGIYYLSMEYLPGGTLQQRIRNGLPLKQALTVARSIAEALHYAHHRGIIHRDIKPQNILFRENGSPVLTDFGIAKTLGSTTRMTRTGLSIGTPRYMSPEQIRGQDVDARADLYSFGVLFYEMLTGDVPYNANDSFALAMMHVTSPIPELPPELRRFQPLLNKLLDKDPNQRFQSGQEIVAALDHPESVPLRSPKPVDHGRGSSPGRVWKAGAAALLAGAALAGGYWFWALQESPTLPRVATLTPPSAPNVQQQAQADQQLRQARQRQQDGALEDSLIVVEQGLQLVPNHPELLALRDQLNRQIADALTQKIWEEQRQQAKMQADQFLEQAQRAQQEGALERSLLHIEQGLQTLPSHPGLLALKQEVQALLADRQSETERVRQQAAAEEQRKTELARLQTEAEQRRRKADELLARALDAQRNRSYETSLLHVEQGLQQAPDHSRLLALRDEVRRQLRDARTPPPAVQPTTEPADPMAALLRECSRHLQANRLTSGKGGNAADCYGKALKRDPGNAEARAGLNQIVDRYADLATKAVGRGDAKATRSAIGQMEKLNRSDPRIADLRQQLAQAQTPAKPAAPPPSPIPDEPEVALPPIRIDPDMAAKPKLDLVSIPQEPDRPNGAQTRVIAQTPQVQLSKTETRDSASMQVTVAPQGLLGDKTEKPPSNLPAQLAVDANVDEAEIFINGRKAGTTPMVIEMRPGAYKVRVRREGYADWNGQVNLDAGDESTLSAVLAKKLDVAVAKPTTPSASKPEPEPEPEPEAKPEPEPKPETKATPSGQSSNCLRGNCENGQGTYRYPDGSEYTGQFRNAKMHGEGTYTYAGRGEKYTGEWRNGVINGQGTYFYRSGNRYDGGWRNGKKHGQGTFLYADRGEKYVGSFANDQPNGQGVYYYGGGDRYEGEWRNGRKNGQGVMYEGGLKIVGEWQNDQKVRVTVEQ